MAETTKIQWTDATFNCFRGCEKVSPGCKFCYAEQGSKRNPKVLGTWGPQGVRVIASDAYWRQPLKWQKEAAAAGERRRVFCCSLADVFEDRPELIAPRARLWELINQTPNLDWQLLTKRPQNFERMLPDRWSMFPPANVWLGVSVEDRKRMDRIDILRQTPAEVRFLSLEPLLEDLGEINLEGIHLAIIGGESGSNARPCHTDWIRSIVRQCQAAKVSAFVKQLGSDPRFNEAEIWGGFADKNFRVSKGGDPADWPNDLRIREMPEVIHAIR